MGDKCSQSVCNQSGSVVGEGVSPSFHCLGGDPIAFALQSLL